MSSNTIYHFHHIVPRHAGGTDDPSNLVKLNIEEHAEAHRKLYKEYGRIQDKLAWQGLSGMIGKEQIISELMSYHSSGENNPMYGRSAVTENNLRWYNNGTENLYITEGTQPDGYVNGRIIDYKKPCSEETKKKISNSLKGNIPPNRLYVVSPEGEVFPSVTAAANSLSMTVSKFRHNKIGKEGWTILR